jgi:hypothetical protein
LFLHTRQETTFPNYCPFILPPSTFLHTKFQAHTRSVCRSHGSTGHCQDPGRVFPGKKMAGRMGGKRRTAQNLTVRLTDNSLPLHTARTLQPAAAPTVSLHSVVVTFRQHSIPHTQSCHHHAIRPLYHRTALAPYLLSPLTISCRCTLSTLGQTRLLSSERYVACVPRPGSTGSEWPSECPVVHTVACRLCCAVRGHSGRVWCGGSYCCTMPPSQTLSTAPHPVPLCHPGPWCQERRGADSRRHQDEKHLHSRLPAAVPYFHPTPYGGTARHYTALLHCSRYATLCDTAHGMLHCVALLTVCAQTITHAARSTPGLA